MNRREFLQALGLGSIAVGLTAAGCGDNHQCAPGQGAGNPFDVCHSVTTLAALMDTLVPATELAPGAAALGAIELMRLGNWARPVIDLGFVGKLPPEYASQLETIDVVVAGVLVADLDAQAALAQGIGTTFAELGQARRDRIVEARLAVTGLGRLYELARAAAFTALLGCPISDRGLGALAMPPYQDFGDFVHTSVGHDFTDNVVPSVDGVSARDETVDGDLP